MAEKSIVIDDAGMAGLAAGCCGVTNGCRTETSQMHDKPGGVQLCGQPQATLRTDASHLVRDLKPDPGFCILRQEPRAMHRRRWTYFPMTTGDGHQRILSRSVD
ncbi:MAG: hypothetical protein QUS33_05035 [Dehalococcoidia bacterium]|nr:hypothetical protein [Dehalococcoidia bacterium]